MSDDKIERRILENNVSERGISDERYSVKLIERIVLGTCGAVGLYVIGKISGLL